jgi:hypothetical protein
MQQFGEFGAAIATNGTRIAVAAPGWDAVYVYARSAPTEPWLIETTLTPTTLSHQVDFGRVVHYFSETIAVRNGDWPDTTQNDSGWTLFERDSLGAWSSSRPYPLDKFQVDVDGTPGLEGSISIDGNRLALSGNVSAGGSSNSRVYVFERFAPGWWTQIDRIERDDHVGFGGFGAALVLEGDRLVIGAPGSDYAGNSTGSFHVYERGSSGMWLESSFAVNPQPTTGNFAHRISRIGEALYVGLGPTTLLYDEPAPGNWIVSAELHVGSGYPYLNTHQASVDRLVVTRPAVAGSGGVSPGAVFVFESATLRVDANEVSVSGDRSQSLALRMGNQWSGTPYFMLGSISGTMPGALVDLGFASATLPINFDAYTMLCLDGQAPIGGQVGLLNQFGAADAVLEIPANLDPAFVGITVNHAAVVASWITQRLAVTNAVGATIVP